MKTKTIREAEIWLADLPRDKGHQQGGIRPVLVVSNNRANHYSPVVDVIPFTTQKQNKKLPVHAFFKMGEGGLKEDSVLMAEQKCTVNKTQMIVRLGVFNEDQMTKAATIALMQTPFIIKAFNAGVHNTVQFRQLAMA